MDYGEVNVGMAMLSALTFNTKWYDICRSMTVVYDNPVT